MSDGSRHENEAQFRLLLADNPRPVWVHDAETLEFLEVNDAAVARYECPREEFLQLRVTDICTGDELAVAQGPWRHRSRTGISFEVETVQHSVQFGGRRAVLVVVSCESEQQRLEQPAGVAHDINNLLTVIAGKSRSLLRQTPGGDTRRRDIEVIATTVARVAELTRRLGVCDRTMPGISRRSEPDAPQLAPVAPVTGVMPEQLRLRPRTRGHVLIVDDDPEVASVLARDLEEAGYGVTTVDDGEKALTAVIKEEPDVVLLDLGMPRLNGIETLGALRAIAPMLQVIIVSGAGTPQDAAKARAFCAFDYVPKPVDAGYLVGRVEAALHMDYEGPGR